MAEMNDAQFGLAKVLRPYPTVTTVYEGQPCNRVIPFLPTDSNFNGQAVDPLAGTPGYSANLMNALAVPLGAKLHIWVPRLTYVTDPNPLATKRQGYAWTFGWRMRTLNCFLRKRAGAYHMPFNNERATKGGPGGVVPLPFVNEGVVYEQVEQAGMRQEQHYQSVQSFEPAEYTMTSPGETRFIMPNGAAADVVQGLYVGGSTPWMMHFERVSLGDELVVGCYRSNAGLGANYAFAGVDTSIQALMTHQNATYVGVYVLAGT